MNILRRLDRSRFKVDFLFTYRPDGCFVEEIHSLGCRTFWCPKRTIYFPGNFKRILSEFGPYDIVHSHGHEFGGYILRLAQKMGVPKRIANCWSDTRNGKMNFIRWQYFKIMQKWINRYSTVFISISSEAGFSLFPSKWQSDPRSFIIPSGVDINLYMEGIICTDVKKEFGIPPHSKIIGHVGRFSKEKNHEFLLKIAKQIIHRSPDTFFLLVGDGPLLPEIQFQAHQEGLYKRVIFTGRRFDIPRLMLNGIDVFLFPSYYEGLGTVLVEAQAAGIPCVYSDIIPDVAVAIPGLMEKRSLKQPETWLNAWKCCNLLMYWG
jgi:glycosyltransferase involved in cell wall biosynthesis